MWIDDNETAIAPEVVVQMSEGGATSMTELGGTLRDEDSRVFVGADALDDGQCTINPMCLTDKETDYVVERIRANLAADGEIGVNE